MSTSWAQTGGASELGPITYRVGKAIMYAQVVQEPSDVPLFTAWTYLADCDGEWATDAFASQWVDGDTLAAREMQIQAWNNLFHPSQDPIQFINLARKNDLKGEAILAKLKRLCKTAPPAPRNLLLPATLTNDALTSFVTGTIKRKGNVIEAWSQNAKFREEPRAVNGPEAPQKTFTGEKSMVQAIYNCEERTVGMLSFTRNGASGEVLSNTETRRKDVRFATVVPGSVGDDMLGFLCKVF